MASFAIAAASSYVIVLTTVLLILYLQSLLNQHIQLTGRVEFVRDGTFHIVVGIQFQILNHVGEQMTSFNLTSNLILEACKVNVQMIELWMIVKENS